MVGRPANTIDPRREPNGGHSMLTWPQGGNDALLVGGPRESCGSCCAMKRAAGSQVRTREEERRVLAAWWSVAILVVYMRSRTYQEMGRYNRPSEWSRMCCW